MSLMFMSQANELGQLSAQQAYLWRKLMIELGKPKYDKCLCEKMTKDIKAIGARIDAIRNEWMAIALERKRAGL